MKRYVTRYDLFGPPLIILGIVGFCFIVYLVFGNCKFTAGIFVISAVGMLPYIAAFCQSLFCAIFRIKMSTGKGTEKIDEEVGQRKKKENENGQKRDSKICT